MTESIKSKLNAGLLTFIVILLGFIASMLSYLVARTDKRIEMVETEQKAMKQEQGRANKQLQSVIWCQLSDPDTSPDLKKALLHEYFEITRSMIQ
jgi:hypothetical protein